MSEHRQITTEAGTFDALGAGPAGGRPVLLLHGFPQAASAWEHQVDVLGHAGLRAIAFDQRGYSPSMRPDDVADYQVDALVGDVLAVADAVDMPEFDLVGHDLGAVVAWHLAAAHPERVRTLTAVSAPHPAALAAALREDEDQRQRSQHVPVLKERSAERRLLADNGAALRQLFEWRVPESDVTECIARLSEPGAMTAALNWFRAERWNVVPDPVTVPTMYVWGGEDVAVGSTAALSCGAWVSGLYRFELVEDASHWVPQEAPDLVAGLLLDHLR
ncbi:Pimeloyl-ACP methyl ester carboxylesterase [Actinokineospora globicatena]|uniref:alpha/beta fold hydrolase n=1 Tax=Actinokineospora globicatena TaxID=103729 RepID=UPI0020A485CA|nr:alpha/beta hydrolase [Actinokineospora globicatena]MCP2304857.1 Pimeloyl-ACP methyl ester carboxylesterase [Actinokineospora globicatena]GLW77762.1 haloalkane dehalogenase [Actinokineospora globicatena]GLW85569.1 haloalkane dehalogenase [Actinokineospora globicatena]